VMRHTSIQADSSCAPLPCANLTEALSTRICKGSLSICCGGFDFFSNE
jgi:hypothetical protein